MNGTLRLTEIPVRWIIFRDEEKVGEGTTVAAVTVLHGMARTFEKEGLRLYWERIR